MHYLLSNFLGAALLLVGEFDTVVLLVPLPVRSGINLNNGVLDQGLCSHKLVVAGVVHDIDDTGLVGVHCSQMPHTKKLWFTTT